MIMSDRDEFTGAHLTPAVKAALRKQARRTNKSMSAYMFEAVREKLLREGVDLIEYEEAKKRQEEDISLPYETH